MEKNLVGVVITKLFYQYNTFPRVPLNSLPPKHSSIQNMNYAVYVIFFVLFFHNFIFVLL